MRNKTTKTVTSICLLICMAALLCCPSAGFETLGAAAAAGGDIPPEYKKVAESGSYEMYLLEDTMSVILRNKSTGAIMRSTLDPDEDDGNNNRTWIGFMSSGLVMTAIQGTVDTHQIDLVNTGNSIEYTYTANGFSAKIYFPQWQFGLTVNAALEGDDFVVWVNDDSIIENNPSNFIGTVTLFPFMGYTYLDTRDGYMLIPDGSGALIYLDDKHGRYSTGFSQMIYGNDAGFTESSTETLLWDFYRMVESPKKVVMPVFGMAHSDERIAYLAIVEQGDERAIIEAQPNGAMVDYNRCYARFILRRVYIQPLNNSNSGTMPMVEASRSHSDMKVRYRMLAGDSADYVGMGIAYREYLLERGLVEIKDTAYRTRVDFLGTDREQFLFGTRAVTMTTTDNIRGIYDDFRAAGVESLLSVYVGWQRGGVYRIPITSYNADGAIGGTRALTRLIADSAGNDYQIYLHNDALRVNNSTSNSAFNTVRMVNRRNLVVNTWQQVYQYFSYLMPERTQRNLNGLISSYTKEGVGSLALVELGSNLFSYSRSGNFFTRFDTAESYRAIMADVSDRTNLMMMQPFALYWKYTDAYLGMPLGSSHYMYQDESVPFMSIVLKGIMPMYSDYVNFEANKSEFKLKMIEAGVYPSFYLTYRDSADLINTNSSDLYSTLYETHKNTVVEYDREFRELAEATGGAFITGHMKLSDAVSVTAYDNGVRVYVNYGNEAVTLDGSFGEHSGAAIPALGYAVVR